MQVFPLLFPENFHQLLCFIQRLDVVLIGPDLGREGIFAFIVQVHGIDLFEPGLYAECDKERGAGNDDSRHEHFYMQHLRNPLCGKKCRFCKDQAWEDTDIFPVPPHAEHMVVPEYLIEVPDQDRQAQQIADGVQEELQRKERRAFPAREDSHLDEYVEQVVDERVEHNHKDAAQGKHIDMPEEIRADDDDGPDEIRNPEHGIEPFEHDEGIRPLPAKRNDQQGQCLGCETGSVPGIYPPLLLLRDKRDK